MTSLEISHEEAVEALSSSCVLDELYWQDVPPVLLAVESLASCWPWPIRSPSRSRPLLSLPAPCMAASVAVGLPAVVAVSPAVDRDEFAAAVIVVIADNSFSAVVAVSSVALFMAVLLSVVVDVVVVVIPRSNGAQFSLSNLDDNSPAVLHVSMKRDCHALFQALMYNNVSLACSKNYRFGRCIPISVIFPRLEEEYKSSEWNPTPPSAYLTELA